MKLFFSAVLFLLTGSVFCQQTSLEIGSSNGAPNNKWDLSKYVWSQAHASVQKANKPPLDYKAIDSWDYLDDSKVSISPNGSYYAFGTYRGDGFLRTNEIMTIQSISSGWRRAFPSKSIGFFSTDSKQYIFQVNDVLNFVQLGTDQIRSIKQVKSLKQARNDAAEWMAYEMNNSEADLVLQNLLSGSGKKIDHVAEYDFDKSGQWLACKLNNGQKELLLYNLKSGEEKLIPYVESYTFSSNGQSMVLKMAANNKVELRYLTLPAGALNTIWSATASDVQVDNFSLDENGKQVVFTVKSLVGAQGEKKKESNSIWYYKAGMDKAVIKANDQTSGMQDGYYIGRTASFTEGGRYIQFEMGKEQLSILPSSDAVMIDVWNYKDMALKSIPEKVAATYKAVINPETDKIFRLEKENEELSLLKGDFAVVQKDPSEGTDRFWEIKNKRDSVWLVSLKHGARQLLPITKALTASICFSPEGKYLVYLDKPNGCHYYSLELATGKKVKISTGIADWKLGHELWFNRPLEKPIMGCGILGWLKEDKAVLVYDDYDIWQLYLEGVKTPVCITNRYGRKNKTVLSYVNRDRFRTSDLVFDQTDTLLLAGFNLVNKYNGFYQNKLGIKGEPELLSMGPYFYQMVESAVGISYSAGMKPIHSSQANVGVVQRESAKEAPNYYVTNDFRTFKSLTKLQSQNNYNWLSSELHSFKQLDGTISQGILYKPENFDPSRKYPVIISFYTQSSGALHQFPRPKYIECAELLQNQAWMVSQGYLVFFPDTYFTKGKWGPSVVNTVVGAANYLSGLSYVDAKHMGACGHSNGGRLSYYLFTHSNCFAAMAASSGTTNIISNGLKMDTDGSSSMSWAEDGFPNGGIGELWKNKATWIDHSSVFNADRAVCPLLILENKKDPSYLQGFEMFTSLRRLEKLAWWLQYDKGQHRIDDPNDLKDYTIRYTQYWDHFLKGAPAPSWMTKGIPHSLKGVESRLDLDPSGNCGSTDKPCVICAAWNKQYKRKSEMFAKPFSEWKLDDDIQKELDKKETERYKKNMVGEAQRIKKNNEKLNGK